MIVTIEEIVDNNNVNIEDNSTIHIVHIEEFESVSKHSQLNLDDGTNPHGTTKQDVGLGNVPNLNTTEAVEKAHTHSNKSVLDGTEESFTSILKSAIIDCVNWISINSTSLINHLSNYSNPHNVSKSQVGLSYVDNTSDLDKPISTETQNALNNKADLVGGKVPLIQLPSYVDDVLEFANLSAFPATGEAGKIYLSLDTNFTYRWGGSIYIKISGGGVKGFHRFQSANFAPAANTTYYIGGNNLGLLATAQTSNLHARVKAMVTGKIGKVSFFASAGLSSGVGANVYLDNITKGTSLTIANNFIWTTNAAVNFISTSDFLVDKGDELTIRLKIGGDGTGGGGGTNNNFWAELTIEE